MARPQPGHCTLLSAASAGHRNVSTQPAQGTKNGEAPGSAGGEPGGAFEAMWGDSSGADRGGY
jgi:hypothetical protein